MSQNTKTPKIPKMDLIIYGEFEGRVCAEFKDGSKIMMLRPESIQGYKSGTSPILTEEEYTEFYNTIWDVE